MTTGYNPADVEAAWASIDSGVPAPPSGYAGSTGLSSGSWGGNEVEQPRKPKLLSSPAFWGYCVGFIVLSYAILGGVGLLGTSTSSQEISTVALVVFLFLQLAALAGGIITQDKNWPRAAGLLVGVLMVLIVIPTCAVAVFFGMCFASLGAMGI